MKTADQKTEVPKLSYRPAEFARLTGMSKPAVYRAIRQGDIPVVRIGRVILIPAEKVRVMLEGGKVG